MFSKHILVVCGVENILVYRASSVFIIEYSEVFFFVRSLSRVIDIEGCHVIQGTHKYAFYSILCLYI